MIEKLTRVKRKKHKVCDKQSTLLTSINDHTNGM